MQITALKLHGRRKLSVDIYLDDELWQRVDAEAVMLAGLQIGQAFDAKAQKALLEREEMILARRAAASYNAGGAKTLREIEHHLRNKRFSDAAVAAALRELTLSGTLDDHQAAERHVRKRLSARRTGPHRLRAELMGRGVESSMAEKLLAETRENVNFRELCLETGRKALGRYSPLSDAANARRFAQYLQRRGYGQDDIFATLEALKREQANEEDGA